MQTRSPYERFSGGEGDRFVRLRDLLLALQKVEGSNPFSRFTEIPLPSGISSFRGSAAFGSVGLRSGRGVAY